MVNLSSIQGFRVAILGLAFKPGTNDVRNAPAINIANQLVVDKADVSVFDPRAMKSARYRLSRDVRMADGIEDAVRSAHAIILATEWDEFINADWKQIAWWMESPRFIFDGRNALDQNQMRDLGFKYRGVGRNSV